MHTTFGGFQGDVALVASNLPRSEEPLDLFRTWMRISIDASRTAHETYATYLSIKSFSHQEGPPLLKRLPAEYQRYYNGLASVVDPAVGSTFLQYILGKALVSCAFWGNIRARVVTKAAISDPKILPEESPDLRLEELLQAFPAVFSGPVSRAVDETTAELEQSGIVPKSFDPNSESDWLSLKQEHSQRADFTYMPGIRNCLFHHAGEALGMPLYDWGLTGTQEAEKFFNAVGQMTNLQLALSNNPPTKGYGVPDSSFMEAEQSFKDLRRGMVTIKNHYANKEKPSIELEDDGMMDKYLTPFNIALTEPACAAGSTPSWRAVTFGESYSGQIYSMDDATLRHALYIHRPLRLSQGKRNVLETILVGAKSLDDYVVLSYEYDDVFSHGDHVCQYPSVFWYMGGNFSEWFEYVAAFGPAYRYVLTFVSGDIAPEIEAAYRDNKESWDVLNHPDQPSRLIVLRNTAAESYLIRLLPGYEANKALLDGPLSKFGRFPEEEIHYLKPTARKILNALLQTWDTL